MQSTIKVLFNVPENEDDDNDFNAYTFVSTALLLVINMFANDLKIPVDYLNKVSFSPNVDIYINFHDEDGVYNKTRVEMIWPHYQNRYCLIYANARLMAVEGILSFTNMFILLNYMVWIINFIFFFIVFRYRMRKSYAESLGISISYSTQSHFMLSIPMFKPTVPERWFLTFKFIQNFFLGTIFVTIFSMNLIVPQVKLATDEEIKSIRGYSPEPISDFGIGESCLHELKRGLYSRRGCFLACDVANRTVQKYSGVVFLKEEINFHQVFKVSKESKHFGIIKKLLRRYFEAGMLDRIFNDIHKTSHKYLEESRYTDTIEFGSLYVVSKHLIFFGFLESVISFILEIAYFRWKQKKSAKKMTLSKVERRIPFTK